MLVLKLAWRSFLRHRRRSIVTVAAVSLSLAMMIFFVGIADDGHARMAELGIHMGAGHVLVQGRGYQAEQTLDHLVQRPAQVMARIQELDGKVDEVVPRVRATGLLGAGSKSAPVLVSGVDPEKEARVSQIAAEQRWVKGSYLRAPDRMTFVNAPADIYLGIELARTLEVGLGDRVVLTLSPRAGGRPASAAFSVRGTFRTGISDLDQSWAEVPLQGVQRLLGLGRQVTQVAILLKEMQDTGSVTAELRGRLPQSLEVLPWQEALKELYDAIALDDASMYLMMAIIFVIVAIGIFNAVLMSVVERTREFGVMMAVGCPGRQLFGVVVTEAAITACVSAAIGLALGLGLHAWVAHTGLDVGSVASDYQFAGIVLEGRMYSRLSVGVVVKWTAVVMGLVMASALYPALRAARLRPLEAIHHV